MATVAESLGSANDLLAQHAALISRVRNSQRAHRRQLRALPSPPQQLLKVPLIPSPRPSPKPSPPSSPVLRPQPKPPRPDLPPAKRARVAHYNNYVPEEETIRNDYSQRYVDGGEWPQNWVLGSEPERRFEEYPKQQRLLALKKASVTEYALPPAYLPFSELSTVQPSKFDVILIDPPFSSSFSWDQLQELPVPSLAADPSFIFLWVGSGAGEGLERGREVLAKWGYRRCEDVCWVKTNKTSNKGPGTDPPTTSLLTRTNQHCLIGIRGTVRRSTDSWFVHCNVDTDVIIWEGDASDPTMKPPEMYTLIENFCLGTRRLELFGRARSVRRGWVTVLADGEERRIEQVKELARTGANTNTGPGDLESTLPPALRVEAAAPWDREAWEAKIRGAMQGGKAVVPMTPEIDALRPKSPVRGGSANASAGANAGMGMGMGAGPAGMQGGAMGMNVGMGPRGMGMKAGAGGGVGGGGFKGAQNQMMAQQPMMGMGMGVGGMDGMGMVNWGGNVGVGMNNMNSMGSMGNMGNMNNMNSMNSMNSMGNMGNMGNMAGFNGMSNMMGMQGGNFGGFDQMQVPVQGMGWMGGDQGQAGQYIEGAGAGGMWDGGMAEGMMGMGNMQMGMGMGMQGMGMGNQGQWNGGGFDGY
ncbi:MT-A70-domain-containing protein [Dentipellis sp. KUC8613]|nr:MT-A70-domain-containing protein [Dentipellis sp. KUC8613]